MQLTNAITITEISEASEFKQARSEVLLAGHATGIKIPGKILEAALQISESRYLLFLTDDVIYEESLNIVLIDLNSGILDQLLLGGQYSTGSLAELEIIDNTTKFKFIGDTTWRVEVLSSPTVRLPFSDPRGVTRNSTFKKYLSIRGNP